MSDQIDKDLELAALSDQANQRWDALGKLATPEPSLDLQRRVMAAAHEQNERQSWLARGLRWWRQPQVLGAMAASCLVGILLGSLLAPPKEGVDDRVAQLESQMDQLGRELLVNRISAASSTERLGAVIEAANVVGTDPVMTKALLRSAVNDPVASIRAAAVAGLGSRISEPGVGDELLLLLEQYDSPTVQLSIIDVVLRYGDDGLIAALVKQASDGTLQEPLNEYVMQSVRGTSI